MAKQINKYKISLCSLSLMFIFNGNRTRKIYANNRERYARLYSAHKKIPYQLSLNYNPPSFSPLHLSSFQIPLCPNTIQNCINEILKNNLVQYGNS